MTSQYFRRERGRCHNKDHCRVRFYAPVPVHAHNYVTDERNTDFVVLSCAHMYAEWIRSRKVSIQCASFAILFFPIKYQSMFGLTNFSWNFQLHLLLFFSASAQTNHPATPQFKYMKPFYFSSSRLHLRTILFCHL